MPPNSPLRRHLDNRRPSAAPPEPARPESPPAAPPEAPPSPGSEPPGEPPPHDPLPTSGHDLPAEPLHLSDMPGDATVTAGRLVRYAARTGRPFVGVLVECRQCRRPHRYNWRWSWGLSVDVVSFQESRCTRGDRRPRWVGLDPGAAAENAAVHREAHEAFEAWAADRAAKKAARSAEAEPRSPDPDPTEAR